jgi:hypothetical protein
MAGFIGVEQALFIPDWKMNENYSKGMVVYRNGAIYRAEQDHNSGGTFIDLNWEMLSSGGGGVPRLYEIVHTQVLAAGQQVALNLEATMNKYDLRTVSFKADKTGDLQVSVYDKAVDGNLVYQSLAQSPIYDIVNVPIEDKDGTGKLHIILQSMSPVDATVTLRAKITSLQ